MQSKFDKHGPEGFLFVVVFLLGIFAISGCIVQVEEPPVTVTTSMTQPTTTVIQSTTTVTETIMPVTLTAIGPWVGAEMEGFMTVLATFTEETCITVEYTPYRAEDLATLLPAQFAAEQSPGDLMFMWALWIKKNTEHILDLSEIIDLSEFTTVADQATIDGRVYGAPYTGKVKPGFWYRLSFFEAHGLEVPTTWEEFISLLDTIQGIDGIDAPIASGDGVGWPLTDVTEHFLLAYGGVDLFEGLKAGTVSWTSPEVTAVFEDYLVPLIADGHFSEPKEWTLI
ncbi:MAG: ABC transporter substrate-binding protein, partial [Candidatus Hodarchaeota archaeon]